MVALPVIFRGGQPQYVAPLWLAFLGWFIGAVITIVVYVVLYTGLAIRWAYRKGQEIYRQNRR